MRSKLYSFYVMAVLLLWISAPLQAQSLMGGVHLGATMDQTIGKDLKGKFNGSFLAGVFVGFRTDKFGVHAEGNFSQTTVTTGENFRDAFGNYMNNSFDSVTHGKFKMNEMSIPVLLSIKVINRVWLQIGPQYTAVVSIKDKNSFLKSVDDVFSRGYISGVGGVWVDLPFHLKASGRYVMGISDRNKTTVSQNWRTGQIQLAIGWML